jgi:hypothetical protein
MLWICRKIADRDSLLVNLLENLGRTFRPAVWHFGVREPPTCHRDCEDSCSVGNHESESCWVVMLLGLVQLFSQSNTTTRPDHITPLFTPNWASPYRIQYNLHVHESGIWLKESNRLSNEEKKKEHKRIRSYVTSRRLVWTNKHSAHTDPML